MLKDIAALTKTMAEPEEEGRLYKHSPTLAQMQEAKGRGRPRKPVAERIACSHYTRENAHCALRATKQLPNGDKVCWFHFNRPRPEPLNTYPLRSDARVKSS